MTIDELILRIRNQIGDNHPTEPNISNSEVERILQDAASEYSRLKHYISFIEFPYDKDVNVLSLPTDSLFVKSVILKEYKFKLEFIDNLDQIILENDINVDSGTIQVTYVKHFEPTDIDLREIGLYFMYVEALCYKLMASKTADYIKFSTGEKMVDESGISKKYLELYTASEKKFRQKANKAYGKRMDGKKPIINYDMEWPIEGEEL